jgi:hypothetical protein
MMIVMMMTTWICGELVSVAMVQVFHKKKKKTCARKSSGCKQLSENQFGTRSGVEFHRMPLFFKAAIFMFYCMATFIGLLQSFIENRCTSVGT